LVTIVAVQHGGHNISISLIDRDIALNQQIGNLRLRANDNNLVYQHRA